MDPRTLTFEEKTYSLDTRGFLDPPEQWDEDFAEGMARNLGIYDGLTEEHWSLIYYLRKKFLEERTVPFLVFACADNKVRLSRLKHLFPTGYHRGACKIAGINYEFMYQDNIWHTYESYSTLEAQHALTDTGFLKDFSKWNRRFAQMVAQDWELPEGVTDRHWQVLEFLRDYYARAKTIPTVYETCETNDLDLRELNQLFPDGYCRGACRMAGLPFIG
ncbi:TusE/DsrC/DsvC family sulfur relay protein [Planctomycetota bacterium]